MFTGEHNHEMFTFHLEIGKQTAPPGASCGPIRGTGAGYAAEGLMKGC